MYFVLLTFGLAFSNFYLLTEPFWNCRGPPGDLYVYLDVEEIPDIQRDGINLNSAISISYVDAILGTVVKVKLHFCLPR